VSAQAADEQTITARVVGVHDGDALTALTDDKRQLKVQLHGIDAPELGQPFGQASKRTLSDRMFGKQVTPRSTGTDRYGRTLAHEKRREDAATQEDGMHAKRGVVHVDGDCDDGGLSEDGDS